MPPRRRCASQTRLAFNLGRNSSPHTRTLTCRVCSFDGVHYIAKEERVTQFSKNEIAFLECYLGQSMQIQWTLVLAETLKNGLRPCSCMRVISAIILKLLLVLVFLVHVNFFRWVLDSVLTFNLYFIPHLCVRFFSVFFVVICLICVHCLK